MAGQEAKAGKGRCGNVHDLKMVPARGGFHPETASKAAHLPAAQCPSGGIKNEAVAAAAPVLQARHRTGPGNPGRPEFSRIPTRCIRSPVCNRADSGLALLAASP